MPHFPKHQGTFSGTNHLWMDPSKPSEESPGTLTLAGDTLDVTWAYKGAPQKGTMTFHVEGDKVEVDWVDTWHAETGLNPKGTATATKIDVFATYPAGPGQPDWGWRSVIEATDKALILRMFNVTPKGVEGRAVELIGTR